MLDFDLSGTCLARSAFRSTRATREGLRGFWAKISIEIESGQGIHDFFFTLIYSVDVYFSSDLFGFMDALSAHGMGCEKRWCWLCGKQTSSSQWRHCKPILRLKPPQKKDKVSLDPSQASPLGICQNMSVMLASSGFTVLHTGLNLPRDPNISRTPVIIGIPIV